MDASRADKKRERTRTELVLAQADLDAMPAALRKQLLLYLVGTGGLANSRRPKAFRSRASTQSPFCAKSVSIPHALVCG